MTETGRRRPQTDPPGIQRAEAALDALDAFADSGTGRKYPSAIKIVPRRRRSSSLRSTAFPPELRGHLHHHSIEVAEHQLRKVTKTAGTSQHARHPVKLLWMAICIIEQTRPRPRQRKDYPANKRRAAHCLIEGTLSPPTGNEHWATLPLIYPRQINQHL